MYVIIKNIFFSSRSILSFFCHVLTNFIEKHIFICLREGRFSGVKFVIFKTFNADDEVQFQMIRNILAMFLSDGGVYFFVLLMVYAYILSLCAAN